MIFVLRKTVSLCIRTLHQQSLLNFHGLNLIALALSHIGLGTFFHIPSKVFKTNNYYATHKLHDKDDTIRGDRICLPCGLLEKVKR